MEVLLSLLTALLFLIVLFIGVPIGVNKRKQEEFALGQGEGYNPVVQNGSLDQDCFHPLQRILAVVADVFTILSVCLIILAIIN